MIQCCQSTQCRIYVTVVFTVRCFCQVKPYVNTLHRTLSRGIVFGSVLSVSYLRICCFLLVFLFVVSVRSSPVVNQVNALHGSHSLGTVFDSESYLLGCFVFVFRSLSLSVQALLSTTQIQCTNDSVGLYIYYIVQLSSRGYICARKSP